MDISAYYNEFNIDVEKMLNIFRTIEEDDICCSSTIFSAAEAAY